MHAFAGRLPSQPADLLPAGLRPRTATGQTDTRPCRIRLPSRLPGWYLQGEVSVGFGDGVFQRNSAVTAHTTDPHHRAGAGNVRVSTEAQVETHSFPCNITPCPDAVSTPAGLLGKSAHCVCVDVDREETGWSSTGSCRSGKGTKTTATPWCSLQSHCLSDSPASCKPACTSGWRYGAAAGSRRCASAKSSIA